jgi:hypothetical protein
MTRTDLIASSRIASGGSVSHLLEELEESGFILRMPQFGLESKDAIYRLTDEYSLFYLSFIERHQGRADNVWLNRRGSPAWRSWSGYAFEGICVKHIAPIKRALGIEAVETVESAWHHRSSASAERGAQIDLLIDRKDACINLCEMKFSEGEFVVDKRYADELRSKRDTFRRATRTRKALLVTMITTHGVRDNQHRQELVDRSLELEALFR